MKYLLKWTDANHKCWHTTKPEGMSVIRRRLHRIMPSIASRRGKHATLITITLAVPALKK